jgi:phosphate transport system substrate-binding protein
MISLKSYRVFASVFWLVVLLLAGCRGRPSYTPAPESIPFPSISSENYPRIDGSTSTSPLGAMIACKALQVPCLWFENISGERHLFPNLSDYQGELPPLAHHGTHSAYVNLINRQADLILVARAPSKDELELAAAAQVTLLPQPIALDAFVFIVNEANPVKGLSLQDLRGIYTGGITNWQQVGGETSEIHPYQRNENSGSQELMRSLVMADLQMIDAPEMVLPKMFAPFYAVSDDPLGIGYSVFYYEENMAPRERVNLCAVEGVMPDKPSIQALDYPFVTEVYAVVRTDLSTNNLAHQLWQWLRTPAGQELIAESGYVPLN